MDTNDGRVKLWDNNTSVLGVKRAAVYLVFQTGASSYM